MSENSLETQGGVSHFADDTNTAKTQPICSTEVRWLFHRSQTEQLSLLNRTNRICCVFVCMNAKAWVNWGALSVFVLREDLQCAAWGFFISADLSSLSFSVLQKFVFDSWTLRWEVNKKSSSSGPRPQLVHVIVMGPLYISPTPNLQRRKYTLITNDCQQVLDASVQYCKNHKFTTISKDSSSKQSKTGPSKPTSTLHCRFSVSMLGIVRNTMKQKKEGTVSPEHLIYFF